MSQEGALAEALARVSPEWTEIYGRHSRERALRMFAKEEVIGQYVDNNGEVMSALKTHKDLDAWKRAMESARKVYEETRKFPAFNSRLGCLVRHLASLRQLVITPFAEISRNP